MQLCIGFNPYKLIPLSMLCLHRDMPCEANITITRQRVWYSLEAGFSFIWWQGESLRCRYRVYIAWPVEHRPGVCFTPRRNGGMACYTIAGDRRIVVYDFSGDLLQGPVLIICEGYLVRALKFDADGEIIAAGSTAIMGFPGMPRPPVQGNVLRYFTCALDE